MISIVFQIGCVVYILRSQFGKRLIVDPARSSVVYILQSSWQGVYLERNPRFSRPRMENRDVRRSTNQLARMVISHFDRMDSHVFKFSEIKTIYSANKAQWGPDDADSFEKFMGDVLLITPMQKVQLEFPYRTETRYIWRGENMYNILASLKSKGYFSHYSAMHLHKIIDSETKEFYLNEEQTPKPALGSSKLTQKTIDFAFRRPARITNYKTDFHGTKLYILNGKHTNNLGVAESQREDGKKLRITDLERTLIDIAVRPEYSGGPLQIVTAYRASKDAVNIDKLLQYLNILDYVYPYIQSIGFYLERTGATHNILDRVMHSFEIKYNFYLTNQMKDPLFCEKWRVYYPRILDDPQPEESRCDP